LQKKVLASMLHTASRRLLSTSTFSSSLKTLHRSNASRQATATTEIKYDYIRSEIATRLVDRLEDVRQRDFEVALELGAHSGHVHSAIDAEHSLTGNGGGIGGVRRLVCVSDSDEIAAYAELYKASTAEDQQKCSVYAYPALADSATPLPFPDDSFDLVISSMSMHWISDLPSTFREIHRVLKPDGAIVLAMAGGSTLPELRSSMVLGEQERDGGVSVHTGPYVDVSSLGMLLTSAGFKLPTVDVDDISVTYPNMFTLCEHLQGMGESNAASNRRRPGMSRDAWLASAALYQHLFKHDDGTDGGGDGDVVASMQVVYGIGWKEHESQQKPDARGAAGGNKIGGSVIVDKSS
jgi:NADH dehydrogenase [ubiquinone] 1 alpha subcomplex assembly factor 5